MTNRRLVAFIDALAAGRRPGHFKADPDDVDVLRTAIALRAARPGDDIPDEAFVSDLFTKLTDEAGSPVPSNVRVIKKRPVRVTLGAVAASLVLVGGTVAATEASNHGAVTSANIQVPKGTALRTGTFEAADGRVLGQVVVYRGNPSWVFMNVDVSDTNGSVTCRLQLDDGSTAAAGIVGLHHGLGQYSKSIPVDVNRIRGATLYSPSGRVMATATFA
jgi:hypothetical protein